MSISLSLLLVFVLILLTLGFTSLPSFMFGYLFIDNVGVYLSLISLIFTISFSWFCWNSLNVSELVGLAVSVISSVVCFTTSNCLLFWVSYELTIIPLVCCIIASSPYSERFSAVWYLLFYITVTSLPMLMVIVSLAENYGSYCFYTWEGTGGTGEMILFLLFITKVPLPPPFHSWLPVVHAEASTYVSIVLSGYVMKLGVVGLLRFCGNSIPLLLVLITIMFFFSLIFFVSSFSELDNKRWLAFLSLSHIMVSILGIYFCPESATLSAVYCVGHGISAGMLFYFFMRSYEATGTRNWLLIASNDNIGNAWRITGILGFLSVASLPPAMTFITELYILGSSQLSFVLLVGLSLYLFIGGVLPLLLLSYFLCNSTVSQLSGETQICTLVVILSLYIVWFLGGII
uniref:NADH-ubiquinone oxidoreductase chain 4 n=1 Tax=Euryhaliotrema johni TaxID=2849187 RepID=A0A8F2TDJ2_9PLAT|nr:NADH dehydrogenase subunit 4 [Euryhaliotrema johni]